MLEHCSNPIGALAQWHTYVRNAGTVVVSLPHVDHCPDKGRHVPSLDHLLMDHLLDRGDDTFESREHIYSFVMGWCDDGFAKGIDKWAMAKQAHLCASSPGNDLHWHAYRPELVLSLIEAAAMFSGCRATIRASGHPDATGDQLRTESEIIFVYTLERMPAHLRAPAPATTAAVVKSVEQKLERALRLVQRATTRGESIGS
ncbi:MAG: hypothetical protein IPJ65_43175 [Archangiaceae bacterium]|nr:hypothetical protein [Archangiaceae bacterium]